MARNALPAVTYRQCFYFRFAIRKREKMLTVGFAVRPCCESPQRDAYRLQRPRPHH